MDAFGAPPDQGRVFVRSRSAFPPVGKVPPEDVHGRNVAGLPAKKRNQVFDGRSAAEDRTDFVFDVLVVLP